MTNFEDVSRFHEKFELPVANGEIRQLPQDLLDFRVRFLKEELAEFVSAMPSWTTPADHAKMFDALLDLVYVALGTAHLLGYPWEQGWNLVQAANMAKVRALRPEDSKRGSAWDVVKPPGWTAPDIEGLLANIPKVEFNQ